MLWKTGKKKSCSLVKGHRMNFSHMVLFPHQLLHAYLLLGIH